MLGPLTRLLPYALAFFGSLCIMVLELVASRLVAQHVGLSLTVWTTVIGVILAGICLGNVLGGRLADRAEPRRVLGPLFALGAALTAACLWLNAYVGRLPGLGSLPLDLRMVTLVTLVFLVPATVLGMISPVVAKIAVVQARRPGGAIGDVYFLGAVGSIVGTFLAGFWLIYIAPTSTIVMLVAAALALIAATLANGALVAALAAAAAALMAAGSLESIGGWLAAPGLEIGSSKVNAWGLIGQALIVAAAAVSWASPAWRLKPAAPPVLPEPETGTPPPPPGTRPKLGDLAALAFVVSLGFMALEMVAGRLVTRHLGSSVYSWTSVIGVLLGGLSLGNYLGGKFADRVKDERRASTLFLFASIAVLFVILAETPPSWLVTNPIGYFFRGEPPTHVGGSTDAWLSNAITMSGYPWWFRVLTWTAAVFFVPALTMGTVSPVVAKLAVDRSRQLGLTGSAIGIVYAWGMVGSIVGTFLTGFLLIDVLGTKGVVLLLAATMALAATILGSIGHAAWAGVPLGLCVIAFAGPYFPQGRAREFFANAGITWGLREKPGSLDLESDIAFIDESNYYYIKVNNERTGEGLKRTLVLDNLIHGYIFLDDPRRLDYDYEHIYALITDRLLEDRARRSGVAATDQELDTLFLGGGSYTFPRYLQSLYPRTRAEVAEIDPAVLRANRVALGLTGPDRSLPEPRPDAEGIDVVEIGGTSYGLGPAGSEESRANYLKVLRRIAPEYARDPETGEGRAYFEGAWRRFGPFEAESSRTAYLEAVRDWLANSKYVIRTTIGDARQYVIKNQDEKVDVIYGDAFNDFSVPWHLTTREFNDKLAGMLADDGVYMINIIDVYESDATAARGGPRKALADRIESALRGEWRGRRDVSVLADDVAGALIPEALEERLREASVAAAEALADDHRPMTRAELLAAIRARTPAGGGVTLEREPLVEAAGAKLSGTRAAEVLTVLSEAREALRTRYERQQERGEARTFAPVTVLSTVDKARTAAQNDRTAADRAATIDRLLARAVEATRSLAGTDPRRLEAEILAQREKAINDLDAERLTPNQASVLLEILGAIETAAKSEAQAMPEGLDPALANQRGTEMAGLMAPDLERLRADVAARARPIVEAEGRDPALAEAAADRAVAFAADPAAWSEAMADAVARARGYGAFLGAWVNTARLTFPHVSVFGTASTTGAGDRETFVVVASKRPVDVAELGRREGEPVFYVGRRKTEPDPYGALDMRALEIRSRGIVLRDDYAPVENLLAPVAETRARD